MSWPLKIARAVQLVFVFVVYSYALALTTAWLESEVLAVVVAFAATVAVGLALVGVDYARSGEFDVGPYTFVGNTVAVGILLATLIIAYTLVGVGLGEVAAVAVAVLLVFATLVAWYRLSARYRDGIGA